jgi:hypothetical protein
MMMLAVMYGMIPSAKIEKLQLLDRLVVDASHADRRAEPVDGDHHDREQDLVAKIRDLEDVLQAGKQGFSDPSVTEPRRG